MEPESCPDVLSLLDSGHLDTTRLLQGNMWMLVTGWQPLGEVEGKGIS